MAKKTVLRSEHDEKSPEIPQTPRTKTPPEGAELSPRASIQLDASGRVAWSRIRPNTRDQLRKMLDDPQLAAQLGVSGPTVAPDDGVPPELWDILFNSASALLVAMARKNGYSTEAASVLIIDDAEKKQLIPLATKVSNKYGLSLGKYQDEILLALALVSLAQTKLTLLRQSAQIIPFPAQPPPKSPDTQPESGSQGGNVNSE